MTGHRAKGGGTATPAERAVAVATISSLLEELADAERDGDDELWNEISGDGVEVVLGDSSWYLSLDGDGWFAAQATYHEDLAMHTHGDGDLQGMVGSRSLSPEEIVRRLDALELEDT
jgi:hypothetical protein